MNASVILRSEAPPDQWSAREIVAEFYSNSDRTTYELIHRHAGYDDKGAEYTRWIPEGWLITWACGFTTNTAGFKTETEARRTFATLQAQNTGGI